MTILLPLLLVFLADGLVCQPVADANPATEVPLLNIVEDFIVDESSTQKIIRVNPVDLPALKPQENGDESELYNIQQISPAYKRKYTLSNSIRRKNGGTTSAATMPSTSDNKKNKEIYLMKKPPTSKHRNNLKRLKFSYNIHTIDGTDIPISRLTRVHIAPGAYPVYYGIAKVNGQFVKNSIKSFSNEEQLIKNLIKIDLAQQKVDDSLDG
ncbi:hypothetical protein ACFFRR_007764 [Megaselia abdita]